MIIIRMEKKRLLRLSGLRGFLAMTGVALIFMLSLIAVAPPAAQAEIPRYINYQGKLTDADDNPVTGDVSITIRIYNASTGGTALWTEVQTVTVTRGIFSMLLGNTTALTGLGFNEAYWYSVEVGSDGEMTPRQRLTAVAYAINADKLDGYDASQFLRADADTTLTGALTVSGTITGSANGDITLDPTGTGNIVMKIDSTSGDFKVTDGTTNYVLVDNATGNVTMSNDLTVSGTIYGTLASTGGNSTFSSIIVTGTSNLRGEISNSTGAVTIADALTQTGSTNQVTFAGNVDANNGLDVTGALTVSGATTLSSALDMNSNIDLDYSGTSAALDVTQASTGPSAQFSGGRVVVGASEASNAYALSTGELYVLGDLEVDGTLYGNVSSSGTTSLGSTTLSSLTVSGASDLQGNISNSTGALTIADNLTVSKTDSSTSGTVTIAAIQPTFQDGGTNSTTTAAAMNVAPTINYTGSTKTGSYTALKIAATETSLPTGTNYLIDAYAGADGTTQKFYVDNSGNAKIFGTLNMNSQKITGLAEPTTATDAATKNYADAVVPASAGGWTDGGTGVYLLTASDNVGIGTTSTGTYKLNVNGSLNATSVYVGGSLIASTNLSDTASIALLGQAQTITGNWVNTTNPWADNEVADALTISAGTIDNSIIGGTTAAAGTFTSLTASSSLSITGDATIDTTGTAALASITQTNNSASLAIATDTTKAGAGAGADSDGVLKLGINEGNYQYIWYDTDAGTDNNGAFIFSDQAVIPTASPAYLNFGVNKDVNTGRYNQYYAIKLDPDVANDSSYSKQKFSVVSIPNPGVNWQNTEKPLFDIASDGSFNIYDPTVGDAVFQIEAGGKLAHDFRNLIKNGSFEAFSGFATFIGSGTTGAYNTNYTTTGYRGGWDNFAPDEWSWVEGKIAQHSPALFASSGTGTFNTDFYDGKSAVAINEWVGKRGLNYSLESPASSNDAGIKQTIKGLQPNTWYSIGAALMSTTPTTTKAIIDITGEYKPATALTALISSSATTVPVTDTSNFPSGGTLLIENELLDYNGKTSNSFTGVTRAVNSTTADSHTSGSQVKGIFKPLMSSTSSFDYKKGSFKTDSIGSDIIIYLLSQQTSAANDTNFARFDAVQLVEGKVLPKYTATSIIDTGDQSIYGTLKLGRSADGRGGILSVDQYVRTRGIDFFSEDPGMSGTMGGGGSVGAPYNLVNMVPGTDQLNTNPPGTVKMDTSGNYIDRVIRKLQVRTQGSYASPDGYVRYRYSDCTDPMNEWNAAAWGAWSSWSSDILIPSTAGQNVYLNYGINVKFSAVSGYKGGDQWEFKAYGMSPDQTTYDSYNKQASYKPSEARIFKDPGTGELTFEDSKAGKVKLSEIINQKSAAYISPPVRDPANQGTTEITASGELNTGVFSSAQNFEIWIEGQYDANGNPVSPVQSPRKYGWSIMWAPGTGTSGTYTYYGNWGQTITENTDLALISSNATDTNIKIKFPTGSSLYNYERWRFFASPSAASNIAAHHHASDVDGGSLASAGTTAASFKIANNSTADPQDINLYFNDYESGAPQNRYVKWNDTTDRFEISNNVYIEGTLTATGIDSSSSNEFNTAMAWNDTTNTVSVTDAGATKSAVITGFLESEADGSTTNEINTFTAGTGGATTGLAVTLAGSGIVTTSRSGDTITITGTEADPLALKTTGVDNVKDTHIDWGAGAGQVSTDDMTEGSTNLYYTNARVDSELDTNQTIGGTWIFSNQVTIPQTPVSATDAASKAYVDAGIAGLSWKEAVLDLIENNTLVPPAENNGDRYLLSKTGGAPHANWDGASAGDMVQFNGAVWVKRTPIDGDAVFVEDVDTGYVYTGTAWTPFTGASAYEWGNGLSAAAATINVGVTAPITVDASNVGLNYDATDFSLVNNALTITNTGIDHDALTNFAANEHIDWTDAVNNIVTSGSIQSGKAGADGALKIYSEQGATDYTATLNPNAAMTSSANFYLPADEPAAASILTMTSTGVIGFDANTYLTVESDPSALKTTGTDNVKDTHIDWGIGAGQVSADDIGDGATNAIITLTQETNFGTAYTHSQSNSQAHTDYLLNNASDVMAGTLTIATAAPSDLIIDNTATGDVNTVGDLASDSGNIILRGNFFTDSTNTNTELDMSMKMDITNAATYKLSFFDDGQVNEIASLNQAGALQIDGGLTIGATALSETNLIDLTDTGATTLHTHTGLAPGLHATAHQTGGSDLVYWNSLSKANGDATTVTSQISSDISTHAALTATHGATGAVVGTTNTQTLTNKTFSDGVNLATSSGNVGIGTTNPTRLLDVNGALITTSLEVRGASPATITFGSGANSRQMQYDPATQEFSFTGGTLKQAFQNLIRNPSFETSTPMGWQSLTGAGTYITSSAQFKFGAKSVVVKDTSASDNQGLMSTISGYDPDWKRLISKTVTLSFWAMADSAVTTTIGFDSTGEELNTSASEIVPEQATDIALTANWQNFKISYNVPADAIKLRVILYGAQYNAGGTNSTSTNNIYFDGLTLVEGKLALDYGPSPIFDTGSQVIYGSLAIGANYNPYSTGDYFNAPRLVFGQPDNYFGGGYGGWTGGSGEIRFMKWDQNNAGTFMFNRGVWLRDDSGDSYGATLRVGSSINPLYATYRGDIYAAGRLELGGQNSGAASLLVGAIVQGQANTSPTNATSANDAYIRGKIEADGGFYGDGSNLTNISAGSVSGNAAITGITGNDFAINADASNPETDLTLTFNRGASDAVLKWNETSDKFDFNYPINVTGGGLTTAGAITNGAVSISSANISGATTVSVNDTGTLTFQDATNQTILQLDETTRTAQVYNLTVNGTQTIIDSTTTNVDHLDIDPGAIGQVAISVNPAAGIGSLTADLVQMKKINNGANVFVIDKDGNITTVGTVDGIDVSGHDTATTAVHGVGAGAIVGTTLTQTLTNKTLGSGTVLPVDGYASTYINTAGDEIMSGSLTAASFAFDNSTLNADTWTTSGSADILLAPTGGNILPTVDGVIDIGAQATIETMAGVGEDSGTGALTLTTSGAFTAYVDNNLTYRVQIDGAGNVGAATYKWSRDGGATWAATTLTTSGTAAALENGLSIAFGGTGGALNDYWDITITKNTGYKTVFANTVTADKVYSPNVTAENSGGTLVLSGNVEITGNLTTQGTQTIVGTTTYEGAQTITTTSSTAFLVENASGTDAFIVDTTTPKVNVLTNLDVSGTLKAGTNDAFQVAGSGAITGVGLNAGTGLITTSGNITTTGAGVMTSAGLLTASAGMNVSGGNIAITDTSNIVLNTNKITLYGATGNATLAGAITQLRSIGLTPDYDSAILRPDSSDNFGTLSVQYANSHNYYEWTTNESTTQDYDIVIRYRLPDGFSSFDATTPIKLWNKVSATPGSTKVDVTMLDTAGASVTLTGGSTLQNTSWTETTITADTSGKTLTPGGYITITIKMSADQGKVADVGELTLKGNW